MRRGAPREAYRLRDTVWSRDTHRRTTQKIEDIQDVPAVWACVGWRHPVGPCAAVRYMYVRRPRKWNAANQILFQSTARVDGPLRRVLFITRPRAPSDPCYFVVPASSRCHPPSNVTATPAPRSRSTRLCSRTTRRLRPRCRTVQVVFARLGATGYPISFLTRFSFAPIGSSVRSRTLPSWPITRFRGSTIASRGSLPLPPDRSRMILW